MELPTLSIICMTRRIRIPLENSPSLPPAELHSGFLSLEYIGFDLALIDLLTGGFSTQRPRLWPLGISIS